MQDNKLKMISNLFEGKEIRSIWDSEKEDYYFSVVDVIYALTDSINPRDYWYKLKIRMTEEEKSQLSTKCRQLKMKSAKDGKKYLTDTLDTEGILRLIESVPSPKAEPFKLWLAKLGKEKIDEVYDPSKGIDQMIEIYLKKGYSIEWIMERVKAIVNRKKLTETWREYGVESNTEYAILTNEIYKNWSGMTAKEYKKRKGIQKESLRDNMSDIEIILTDLGEIATRELTKTHQPLGLEQNKLMAEVGGNIAFKTRKDLEYKLGKEIISDENHLNHKYIEDDKRK